VLARFPGCTTAKVKVAQAGQALADDVDRVAAVRDVLGAAGGCGSTPTAPGRSSRP
jgi:O-succinylbenzoate synthase